MTICRMQTDGMSQPLRSEETCLTYGKQCNLQISLQQNEAWTLL